MFVCDCVRQIRERSVGLSHLDPDCQCRGDGHAQEQITSRLV